MAEPRNHILRRLPAEERRRLLADSKAVHLGNGQVIYDSDEIIKSVCFPETAVISIICLVKEGGSSEIGLVGTEGIAGLEVVLGGTTSTQRAVSQVPGDARLVNADVFRKHMRESEELRKVLADYIRAYCAMLAQLIVCNRLHRVEQRAARWLSMTADRIDGSSFPMTQERLGMMLGSQRPTVNATMAALRDAGCIETSRGQLRIVDRKRLESYACECYEVCSSYFQKIFPMLDHPHNGALSPKSHVVALAKKARRRP